MFLRPVSVGTARNRGLKVPSDAQGRSIWLDLMRIGIDALVCMCALQALHACPCSFARMPLQKHALALLVADALKQQSAEVL